MEAMAKQKMPPLLNMNENDEFAQIYEQYNQMIMDTNRLMKEKMDAEYQSKLSQLRQLQYQIQPHFLYNSLFTIILFCIQHTDVRRLIFSPLVS